MPKASGLPFQTWPPADQALWTAAFRASDDPFSESRRASHLTGETRRALRSSYGTFLRFLSVKHPERLASSPSTRIDRDIAMQYVEWRRPMCGAATIATGLDRLRLAISYMCPGADISWLLPIAKRLAAQAAPKPARLHLVTSDQLYALGIELMDDAEPSGSDHKGDAFLYRDGLIIALLAVAPLRRSTLAALRVGEHLLKSGDLWVLEIPAKDMKTRQSLDFLLSGPLSARIDRYLAHFRDAIPGATKHTGLWPSNWGRPMADGAIYDKVRQRTREGLGFPVNLHRFRHAAATFWSISDPKNVRGAKDLLGHASFGTTEKHYVMAQSQSRGAGPRSSHWECPEIKYWACGGTSQWISAGSMAGNSISGWLCRHLRSKSRIRPRQPQRSVRFAHPNEKFRLGSHDIGGSKTLKQTCRMLVTTSMQDTLGNWRR